MLHQHPRQLPHQHLTLKNKIINFKNYKKQKNIIKKKWWNLDLWGLTQNVHNKHKPRFKYNITNPDLSTSFSASLSFFLQSSFFLPLFLLSPSILVLSLLELFKQVSTSLIFDEIYSHKCLFDLGLNPRLSSRLGPTSRLALTSTLTSCSSSPSLLSPRIICQCWW